MPYNKEISRQFKGCILFLVDQSLSTESIMGNSSRRICDEIATAINAWLQNMIIRASADEGIRDYMDIGVLGYTTDANDNPIVAPALGGALEGKKLASIKEIDASPLRNETLTQKMSDPETEELIEMQVEVPIWVEPKLAHGTPMCQAMHDCCIILDEWIAEGNHRECFPPIVIHITDGESSDGNPTEYAEAIKQRETNDGNVLLFNCHLSPTPSDSFMFPSSNEVLPDDLAKDLFNMSSVLPDTIYQRALSDGYDLKPNARGMAFNADMVTLIKFLDMGTRAAKVLR